MKIKSFTFNPFQENTYIVYDETKKCIIIDPGCYTEEEQTILSQFIISKVLYLHECITHALTLCRGYFIT